MRFWSTWAAVSSACSSVDAGIDSGLDAVLLDLDEGSGVAGFFLEDGDLAEVVVELDVVLGNVESYLLLHVFQVEGGAVDGSARGTDVVALGKGKQKRLRGCREQRRITEGKTIGVAGTGAETETGNVGVCCFCQRGLRLLQVGHRCAHGGTAFLGEVDGGGKGNLGCCREGGEQKQGRRDDAGTQASCSRPL